MSEYEALLKQLRDSSQTIAKNLIPKLYKALRDEGKSIEEARTILQHDIGDLYSKRAILANLPDEAKSENAKKLKKLDKKKPNSLQRKQSLQPLQQEFTKETIEPELEKEEVKPEKIIIDTSGAPINAADEPEHLPDQENATEQWKEQAAAKKPEKTLIEVVCDGANPKFGGALFAASRNKDKLYLSIDLARKEVIGMETGAERRLKKVMEAKTN